MWSTLSRSDYGEYGKVVLFSKGCILDISSQMRVLWKVFDHKSVVCPIDVLLFVLVEDQGTVGTSETKTIGHGTLEWTIVSLGQNVHAFRFVHKLFDIC